MIEFLNAQSPNREIARVLVGYSVRNCPLTFLGECGRTSPGFLACGYVDNQAAVLADNDFYKAIKDVTLADGREAKKVIVNTQGHCDHFDVRYDLLRLPNPPQ